jgi:P27 family predicted phage terminase small subunit
MAGRPRKPTALKILEGNRGHRPLNPEAEPRPAKGLLRTPSGMSKEARKLWRTLSAELDRLDLLTVVDETALKAACLGAATAEAADIQIAKIQARMAKGKPEAGDYTNLAMLNNVSKRGWQQYKSFATEFGLTPASRSRINVDPGKRPSGSDKRLDPIESALCG